jgi:hypothetical protein
MAVRSEGVICPLPRLQFATAIGYYGFCGGLVADCGITADDDASSPIRLNRLREAKERRVRGLPDIGGHRKHKIFVRLG